MQGGIDLEQRKKTIQEKMLKIKNKIIVMSGKGGVGKTTVSVNLGYGLAKKGYKVGILDADLHGPNVPIMFGKEGIKLSKLEKPLKINDNLKITSLSFFVPDENPIIWRGPQKLGAIQEMLLYVEWGEIDFLIVDLPPGTGDETLTIAQDIGKDARTIIVTTPQKVALLDSRRGVKFSKLLNLQPLGIIENMSGFVCPDCNQVVDIFKKGGAEEMAVETKTTFLGAIPMDKNVVEAGDNGCPYVENENSIATVEMNKIIKRILTHLDVNKLEEK